jgi:hypothetical protein
LSSQLFLKYNFKARKFCVNFTIKSNKRQLLKNADFFLIWLNFFKTFADNPVWDLETVPSASQLFGATSNWLPLQILNETQVPTTATLEFPSIYLYTL